jgi:Restriction endonuclease
VVPGTIELLDYKHSLELPLRGSLVPQVRITGPCPYCGTPLRERYSEFGRVSAEPFGWESYACICCGWWWSATNPERSYGNGTAYVAVLNSVGEIHSHLAAGIQELNKSRSRLFEMNPTMFEHFVGDLLGAFYDCKVIHCGKSHDRGIDLLLIDSNHGKIPVQVKRRVTDSKTESVSVVREFRGALILAGSSEGKIVTSGGHFSQEAVAAATPRPEHSAYQQVDLIDCRRLLNILGVVCVSRKAKLTALTRNALCWTADDDATTERITKRVQSFAEEGAKNRDTT